MINWETVKFRASSWGNLLSESKDKKEPIGKTCAGELLKIYNQVKYGRREDIVTAAMDKGKQVEDQSIQLFSMLEGKLYYKNEEQLENDWCTGHPDIFSGEEIFNAEEVHDIKSSWSVFTFMPKLLEGVDKAYEAQLNCYYSLTGAQGGSIAYCLVSAPPNIVESEKRKLLFSMNVATEFSPEYLKAAEALERNLIYDDIPPEERVIKINVPRNEELIEKMKAKVPLLREWLYNFDQKHSNQYNKQW